VTVRVQVPWVVVAEMKTSPAEWAGFTAAAGVSAVLVSFAMIM
jgi:hypothetical protein